MLPIILAYRKYYGQAFRAADHGMMFVTMVRSRGADRRQDLQRYRPDPETHAAEPRYNIFGSVQVDYKLFLNVFGLIVFAALFWMTRQRGATDPVCGMRVDRQKAVPMEVAGETLYFCSDHCWHAFESDPQRYLDQAPGGREELPNAQ